MHYEFNGPFKARELFTLKDHFKQNILVPEYANKRAVPTVRKDDPRFLGTGIYGVLFQNKLIYVGIFTGIANRLFKGSVVHERWKKHLTFFTMRSPECAASPTNLRRILLELKDAPAIVALADLIGAEELSIGDLKKRGIGFSKGSSTQLNKVRFATKNWESFRPGKETEMMEQISFVYARLLPEVASRAINPNSDTAYAEVKKSWLEPRERRLFTAFLPACNSQTVIPNDNVDADTFINALKQEMGQPLSPLTAV